MSKRPAITEDHKCDNCKERIGRKPAWWVEEYDVVYCADCTGKLNANIRIEFMVRKPQSQEVKH